jgi:arabinogalactan endo-1,4-beta-galactosidase
VTYNFSSTYPINGEGQKAFTEALIETINKHSNVNGFFWWWMEANEYGLDWNTKRVTDGWYNAGLFDNQTGRAEPALYVLKNFLSDETGIEEATNGNTHKANIYTINGMPTSGEFHSLPKGVYIVNGNKIVKK